MSEDAANNTLSVTMSSKSHDVANCPWCLSGNWVHTPMDTYPDAHVAVGPVSGPVKVLYLADGISEAKPRWVGGTCGFLTSFGFTFTYDFEAALEFESQTKAEAAILERQKNWDRKGDDVFKLIRVSTILDSFDELEEHGIL